MTIQGAAQKGAAGVVSIEGGDSNTLGGCTIRNAAMTAVSVVGGFRHSVIGNDIIHAAARDGLPTETQRAAVAAEASPPPG